MARERWRCEDGSRDQRDAGLEQRQLLEVWEEQGRDLVPGPTETDFKLLNLQNCKINLCCFNPLSLW